MKRNRRDGIRKERIIMVTSSALVLAALTMTGLYLRGQEAKQQDDGYTLDFTALENGTQTKLNEIGLEQAKNDINSMIGGNELEGELDYMPLDEELSAEVDSHLIEIPGLTDGLTQEAVKSQKKSDGKTEEPAKEEQPAEESGTQAQDQGNKEPEQSTEGKTQKSKKNPAELHYSEEQGLTRPVNGEVLLPYSMDGSVYFATLDQYKYNPATLFAADEGALVVACAEGRVKNVFEDAELGHALTLELGNGYEVTYGQLADVQVKKDSYVKAGEKLGTVAAPSKYYSLEGSNLYFRMEKDGKPLNSEYLF